MITLSRGAKKSYPIVVIEGRNSESSHLEEYYKTNQSSSARFIVPLKAGHCPVNQRESHIFTVNACLWVVLPFTVVGKQERPGSK